MGNPQTPRLGGLDSGVARQVPAMSDLAIMRACDELDGRIRDASDADKAVRLAARFAGDALRADHRCVAVLEPGLPVARVIFTGVKEPGPQTWPADMLGAFARGERPDVPFGMALARLRRRRRAWGVLALRWTNADPDWAVRNTLTKLAGVVNDAVERIEERRLAEVRNRIDRKIMEQLRPKDLLYQILDGLRSLTGYDHSGSIFLRVEDSPTLELVAEQIAFRKGKSARIGMTIPIPPALRAVLRESGVMGFSSAGDAWTGWTGLSEPAVRAWLAAAMPNAADERSPAESIVAPLVAGTRGGGGSGGVEAAGLLVINSVHPGTFELYEADLIDRFLPHAMIAIQNARRAESLEDQVILAERKHAMAELARGVSHDVNNALGAVLPLVQQLRADADEGRIDRATLSDDLAQVEQSIRTSIRIFAGMLQFARRAATEPGSGDARPDAALDAALAILGDRLRKGRVEVHRAVAPGAAALPLRQSDLDQVVLNLLSNAHDAVIATAVPGRVSVEARPCTLRDQRGGVRIEVTDTGVGIPSADLPRVLEPFFTTKPTGNGLGLAVCRSIVWQAGGRIEVDSPAFPDGPAGARGTRVTIEIPLVRADGPSGDGGAA